MNLKIDIHQQSDKEILVTVAGEIDAYTAPKLREELFPFAEGDNTIIVQFKECILFRQYRIRGFC